MRDFVVGGIFLAMVMAPALLALNLTWEKER
jgi:hypothetical protein